MEDTRKKVLIIGGATTSGESTVTRLLTEQHHNLVRVVTATSREMRSGEAEGREYYFFSKKEFLERVKSGDIIEHTYVELRDVYYGTYKKDLETKMSLGKIVVINTDVVAVRYFRERYHILAIFIDLPSFDVIGPRLLRRNPETTEEMIALRVKQAEMEIVNERGEYDYHVMNEEGALEMTMEKVQKILSKEEYI